MLPWARLGTDALGLWQQWQPPLLLCSTSGSPAPGWSRAEIVYHRQVAQPSHAHRGPVSTQAHSAVMAPRGGPGFYHCPAPDSSPYQSGIPAPPARAELDAHVPLATATPSSLPNKRTMRATLLLGSSWADPSVRANLCLAFYSPSLMCSCRLPPTASAPDSEAQSSSKTGRVVGPYFLAPP